MGTCSTECLVALNDQTCPQPALRSVEQPVAAGEGVFLSRVKIANRQERRATWQVWYDMLSRCFKTGNHSYHNYGKRGITVCDRWVNSFEAFLQDMGKRPSPAHSIDRIDNDGNYEPDNCRWATLDEQARNNRRNNLLTLNGKTMCITDWAAFIGIDRTTLRDRLKTHSVEDALRMPRRLRGQRGKGISQKVASEVKGNG